jgi:diacylglycerol kinase (ATP)
MRAAAILGLSSSEEDLKPFQRESNATWLIGMPASSSDADAILIFGGDGTVHRHLAQLVRLQLPVLVVPRGSGNDFARALRLRSVGDALAAWRSFSSGGNHVRAIDLGVITPLDAAHQPSNPGTGHYFCCVGGVGLDAETARRANKLPRWLRGHGGYALSLPTALLRFAAFAVRISVLNSEENSADSIAKPVMLAAFANAPAYGGGFRIAPRALLDDGELDVCVVGQMDKLKLFRLFPSVYFGRHLTIPEVQYFQAEKISVETDKPLDIYADGEYVCRTPVEVSVARATLRVVVLP